MTRILKLMESINFYRAVYLFAFLLGITNLILIPWGGWINAVIGVSLILISLVGYMTDIQGKRGVKEAKYRLDINSSYPQNFDKFDEESNAS